MKLNERVERVEHLLGIVDKLVKYMQHRYTVCLEVKVIGFRLAAL